MYRDSTQQHNFARRTREINVHLLQMCCLSLDIFQIKNKNSYPQTLNQILVSTTMTYIWWLCRQRNWHTEMCLFPAKFQCGKPNRFVVFKSIQKVWRDNYKNAFRPDNDNGLKSSKFWWKLRVWFSGVIESQPLKEQKILF